MKEVASGGKGTAAHHPTVCALRYFKPASGSELDAGLLGGWGVGTEREAVVREQHTSVSIPKVLRGEALDERCCSHPPGIWFYPLVLSS